MKKTALVIMAAGIGSRCGKGIKQLAPVGPSGEIIMDYSIHDALEAGFNKIVFIIRRDLEQEFRRVIGDRIEKLAEVEYVFQELDDLPEGFEKPEGRTKPWGTGQAVLCCKGVVKEPFAVINADDYYGKDPFVKLHEYLVEEHPGKAAEGDICMAGFVLKNTLSDNGGVTRGICTLDEENRLVGVAEKTVQIAFKEAIDNEPCLIFIDEVEDVCVDRNSSKAEGHEKRLTVAFLEAYNLLRESGKRVIFMGATNHPGQVDSAMLDRVKLIRIPLPDEKTREAFFTRKLDTLTLEEGFTYADMAAVTDNYSYRDLESLTDTIAIRTKHRTIENYRVENEGGNMDVEQTDIAGSEALRSGEILLTRELFEQTRRELPPSDKSRVWAELKAFEEKMNPMNG